MNRLWAFSVFFYASTVSVVAQEYLANNFWIEPPGPGQIHDFSQNKVYQWGSQQEVKWFTSWNNISIKLFQNDNDNYWVVPPENFQVPGSQGFIYTAVFPAATYDPNHPPVFFFRTNNVGDEYQSFSSHYFNLSNVPEAITNPRDFGGSSSTTSSTSTPSPTPSQQQTSEPPAAPQTTSSESPATSPTIPAASTVTVYPTPTGDAENKNPGTSNNLSGGAIAGVTVGTLAGVALIAAILWLCWSRHHKKIVNQSRELQYFSEPGNIQYPFRQPGDYDNRFGPGGDMKNSYQPYRSPMEAPASSDPVEMGGRHPSRTFEKNQYELA